ncbi:MAG: RNA-binding S4 domain-containing protein [Oscillospiraceae bacterium]
MRIDKYLKVSRLIKRRTVANEVADAGKVMVNGRAVKASYTVKVGDVIEIAFAQKPLRARVLSLEVPKGKDIAREMYELVD